MWILGMLAGLGVLVCFVMVLIKQFQIGGPIHGIIGILTCGLWTFIWGWMNANKVGKNLMLAYTVLWVLSLVINIMSGGFAAYSGFTSME